MGKSKSPKGKSKKDKTDSGKKKKDKKNKDGKKASSAASGNLTKKESKPKTGSSGEKTSEQPTTKQRKSSLKSKQSDGNSDGVKKSASSNDRKKHHQKRRSHDADAHGVEEHKISGKQKSVGIKSSTSKHSKHDFQEPNDEKNVKIHRSRENSTLTKKKSVSKSKKSDEKKASSKSKERGSFEAVRAKLKNIRAKTEEADHEAILQDIESRKQLRLKEGANVRENLENWKKSLKKVEKGKEKTYEKKQVPARYKQMEEELKNMPPNEWYVAPFTTTASSCKSGVGVAPPMGPIDRPRSQCPWLYNREYDIGLLLNAKPCATNPWTKGELPGVEGDEEYLKLLKAKVKRPFGTQVFDAPQPQNRKDSFAVPAWQSFPAGPSKPGFVGTSDISETNEQLVKYESFRGGRSSETVMKQEEPRHESLQQKSALGITRISQPMNVTDMGSSNTGASSGMIAQQTEMAYIMGLDSPARSNNARVRYR